MAGLIGNLDIKTATIASSAALSTEIDLEGYHLAGIIMPAAWTAAALTFQGSDVTGGTYRDLYDDRGVEVEVLAAADRAIGIDLVAGALAMFRFLKIRSGTTAIPVNQAAARTLILAVKI